MAESLSDLKQTYREKTCPVCGKLFITHGEEWGYTGYSKGRKKFYCSWGCLRKSEKGKQSPLERRQIIIQAIRDGLTNREIYALTGEDLTRIAYWRKKLSNEK